LGLCSGTPNAVDRRGTAVLRTLALLDHTVGCRNALETVPDNGLDHVGGSVFATTKDQTRQISTKSLASTPPRAGRCRRPVANADSTSASPLGRLAGCVTQMEEGRFKFADQSQACKRKSRRRARNRRSTGHVDDGNELAAAWRGLAALSACCEAATCEGDGFRDAQRVRGEALQKCGSAGPCSIGAPRSDSLPQ
jgi:hypothetical protein